MTTKSNGTTEMRRVVLLPGETTGPGHLFSDLRHASATVLRSGNIDLKTVSERLGHSNIGITGDLYTHGVGQADRDAATMLQTMVRGTRR